MMMMMKQKFTLMPPKTLKLLTFGLVSLTIALAVTFGVYIPYLKAYNLVHPKRTPFTHFPAGVGISHYEDVQFTTSDGLKLKGWYIPPQNGKVIIFLHGLGSDRQELLDEAGLTVAKGYGALLFDMRACGESEGTIATLGYNERLDIHAAVDFVHSRAGANTPLALFGHSMGSGAALLAAPEIPELRAVIVESAFASVEDNINEAVQSLTGLPPFPFAPLIIFFGQQQAGVDIKSVRPIDVVAKISPTALLFIHGDQDTTIPVRNAYALYAAAKEPKQLYILPGVNHGGFLQAEPERFPKTILTFLETYLK